MLANIGKDFPHKIVKKIKHTVWSNFKKSKKFFKKRNRILLVYPKITLSHKLYDSISIKHSKIINFVKGDTSKKLVPYRYRKFFFLEQSKKKKFSTVSNKKYRWSPQQYFMRKWEANCYMG